MSLRRLDDGARVEVAQREIVCADERAAMAEAERQQQLDNGDDVEVGGSVSATWIASGFCA